MNRLELIKQIVEKRKRKINPFSGFVNELAKREKEHAFIDNRKHENIN